MADLEKTVRIVFEGQDKDLTNSIAGVAGKFDKISAAADQIAEPLAKAADAVLKVDAAIAAMAVGAMVLAVKQSKEFNQGFALISTSVDATGEDLARYREQILDYSTTSVKSITDLNAALYTAAQAGITYGDSLEFMGKAEQLAVANNANLNTTVDLLTGTMNAYGYQLKDVAHINDVLFTSTLIGKQTIDELGQSMGQVVGIAANFGVSFEDLSGAITTLTAKGMQTSDAITAVKGVITAIVSPSVEAAKAASELGLTFSASSLKADGLGGMLSKVMTATGGSADKMSVLFGNVRALNGAMQLTGDGMEFFNGAMEKINSSAGVAEEAYKKMVLTFENQSQLVINAANTLLIDVGSRLEPVAAKIAGSLGQVLTGIKIGVDQGAFDPLFAMLDEASGALSAWLAGVAKALPDALKDLDFDKLLSALRDLTRAFGDYFDGMDLTTVEDLHDFIQKLIDAIGGLVRITAGMVDAFRPFFTTIKDLLLGIANGDAESQKMVGTLLTLGKVVKEMGLAVVIAMQAINEFGLSAVGVFNIVAGGVQIVWNFIEQLANLGKVAALVYQGKFTEIPGVLQQMKQDGYDAEAGVRKIILGFEQLGGQSDKLKESVGAAREEIEKIPSEKKAIISFEGTEAIKSAVNDIAAEFVKVGEAAEKALPAEKWVVVGYIEDETGRREIREKIDATVPKEKTVDVKLETERLKEQAKIIETAITWKAKLDIAQVEAGVKNLKTMFDSVDTGIKSTGDLIGQLFGQLDTGSRWNEEVVKEQIDRENQRRQQEFDLQKKLTEQQIALNKLKLEAAESGKGMAITITSSGLEPHLELIMWEILKKIQVRANATAAEFLLGVA